jgi:hypothetical protein
MYAFIIITNVLINKKHENAMTGIKYELIIIIILLPE